MDGDSEMVPAAAAAQHAAATVLVIEDDYPVRKLLAMHLSAAGYAVLTAEDPRVGGQMLRASRPDVLLIDIRMPYMNGMDFVEELRRDPSVAHTPVLFLTSMSDEESYNRAERLGAAGFLGKPVHRADLLAAVKKALPGAHRLGGAK